jgi:hypothetical protein
MLKEVARLISFMDVLYYVGDLLYKRSLRYTGVTAMISLVGYLGNWLPGIDTYPADVAIVLPLLVGSAMLIGGFLLKSIPNLVAVKAVNVAEAQDLDLMEDYRKSREEIHLESLWRRVFKFEWSVGSAASRVHEHPVEAPNDVCFPQPPPKDSEVRWRREFISRARFGLASPKPQTRQRHYLGVDLRFVEDWRNGGYFDRSDQKLHEQYDASALIEVIKREVGYDRWTAMREFPIRFEQRLWFRLITRAVSIQVGDAIAWMNQRFNTTSFNAQAILWPGEEQEPWVNEFRLASRDLAERRRLIFLRVFGESDAAARRMLDRVLWPSFWLASRLRVRFDPEYADGSLGYDIVSDLEQAGLLPACKISPFRRLGEEVAQDAASLMPWLQCYRTELLAPENAESLRAVRVALHVRRNALRGELRGDTASLADREGFATKVLPVIDAAVRSRVRTSELLGGLRVHHELTRLHREEYLELLELLRK